ncbi:MAG: hypothetical protein PHP74_02670, partial [Candidatus Gracilibacteria bacterium]|nr:hypothetical protein [Candidatus Gracilibacteria bacterium]
MFRSFRIVSPSVAIRTGIQDGRMHKFRHIEEGLVEGNQTLNFDDMSTKPNSNLHGSTGGGNIYY